jgi:hypothetical protein
MAERNDKTGDPRSKDREAILEKTRISTQVYHS